MTRIIIPLIMSAGILFTACGEETDDSSLTIQNDSDFAFIEINLSPTNQTTWGADLLGTDILRPGQALEVSEIDCGDYDIRVIDEDTDECILEDVNLCFSSETWTIDNLMLGACVSL